MKLMPHAAAAIAAVMSLAACGQSAGTSSAAAAKPTCHQQYETWKHGPPKAVADELVSKLKAVQSVASAQDILHMNSAISTVGKAATTLRSYPIPRCADPKGYYDTFLSRIIAAGDNARPASGLGGLLLHMAPLRTLPGIQSQLIAELNQTVGKKH